MAGWLAGWVAGSIGTNANSASVEVEIEVEVEAELGNISLATHDANSGAHPSWPSVFIKLCSVCLCVCLSVCSSQNFAMTLVGKKMDASCCN